MIDEADGGERANAPRHRRLHEPATADERRRRQLFARVVASSRMLLFETAAATSKIDSEKPTRHFPPLTKRA